ncbi:MAG: glycine dehydrogenase (aminomethyl-transferring) [Crocinitomicaceae bacterium]|nr:glycine dehydrogenase (aminomethyl-transferring) [Crocinitomicaceae bacterium]|tara:strand:- start:26921 stop:29782 length:2862 start_codon:yes stop_codon:yes gene_type:complete
MENFKGRHIGPRGKNVSEMLEVVGSDSIDNLINETIPAQIRLKGDLDIPEGISEFEYLRHIDGLAERNQLFRSYIGQGYYGTITPSVIKRNLFENPGWYTAYTPYQAEISQGRLEALLNFQTVCSDLTGMELANGSLLDESTAAAEAMILLFHARSRDEVQSGKVQFFVDENCFTQTIEVLETRSNPLNIELVIGDWKSFKFTEKTFGALLQYPNKVGAVEDYSGFVEAAKQNGARVAVASDLMALIKLKPPGEWGADVVVGNSQRFGVPMGFGGPHAAFFATQEEFKRFIPGRIIGVSQDRNGNRALRMALQTREQHIKRDRATSNICTAQALLANMAGSYAVYHGPEGLKEIASRIHERTNRLACAIENLGYELVNDSWFDTLTIKAEESNVKRIFEDKEINLWYGEGTVTVSLDETVMSDDVADLVTCFAKVKGQNVNIGECSIGIPPHLNRTSKFLTHPTFNSYHSESEMLRYLKTLENKDISLTHSMISLGSCTMKLNAAAQMYPVSKPEFANMHPFSPADQTSGYDQVIEDLEEWLCAITGFAAISFQPNSGAQGEYTGLLTIRAYHKANGDHQRKIALIPSSAHGTNPASAVMAGMEVVVVKSLENGNIDVNDLREKAEKYSDTLSCLMVTYPSTHGVFEESIIEMTDIIHANGGQVYMDGANMNAQVGLTSPGNIGADVCHLNLHKTFAIPHGGGGPGVGPIGVAEHLAKFLPGHSFRLTENPDAVSAVSGAPYGSASILLISYAYCKMLGKTGLRESTEYAILNANYIKNRLEDYYPVLYLGESGRVAHEMILDCRGFKKTAGIEVVDIAKRLIDYGFHAPTVSFPVAGTLMIEPTESESKSELDRFCSAMISIRKEIAEIEDGTADRENNVVKNAPHRAQEIISSNWDKPYSREKAAYPMPNLLMNKYWAPVARIDDAFGDRNLICACPPLEDYEDQEYKITL